VKKLHVFILKTFTGPLILTFFIVTFLLLMQFLWKYIDDLVGKGLDIMVIAELLLYTSASLIPMALPLAILLAALMTFGNLGEHFELTALKAAGVSLQRIMFPLIMLIVMISIGAFFFSNNMLPYTNLKMRTLLYDVQHQRPELQIMEGTFYNGIENYSIKIAEKEPETELLKGIKIYDHTDRKGNTSVTVADSGYMKMTGDEQYLILTLYNGRNYIELESDKRGDQRTFPMRRDDFQKQVIFIELTGFGLNRSDENLFKNSYQMMNLDQLEEISDSLSQQIDKSQERFYKQMRLANYNKAERAYQPRKSELDTSTFKTIHVKPDSLFSSLTLEEKNRALTQAVSFARTAKNQLNSQFIGVDNKIRRLRKYEIEWHRKFTLSFACLIFFFIGAPLGAIIRKGGLGMPAVISILFFVLYYVISLSGEKFVREDMIRPYQGMWISSFILFPLGVFLTYKATTDSVIMNIDTYLEGFKKAFNFLKIKPFMNRFFGGK